MIETGSKVTLHAGKRIRERMGVKKKSIQTISDRAYLKGLNHNETAGHLKRYIDKLYFRSKTANNIKVFAEKIYLFNEKTLITVVPLPTSLKRIANKLAQSKKLTQDKIGPKQPTFIWESL